MSGSSSITVYGEHYAVQASTPSISFVNPLDEKEFHDRWRKESQPIMDSINRSISKAVKKFASNNSISLLQYRREFDDPHYREGNHYLDETIGDLNGVFEGYYNDEYRNTKSIFRYRFFIPIHVGAALTEMRIMLNAKSLPSKNQTENFKAEIITLFSKENEDHK